MGKVEREELEVDVKEICQQALEDLQPGEDIDEALLRASKRLYKEEGMNIFSMVNHMVSDPLSGGSETKIEKVKGIANGDGSHNLKIKKKKTVTKGGGGLFSSRISGSIVTTSSSITTGTGKDIDFDKLQKDMPGLFSQDSQMSEEFAKELPPEVRSKLPSGSIKVNFTSSRKKSCSSCGYLNPEETSICINCHAEFKKKKRSFWDKLLGR